LAVSLASASPVAKRSDTSDDDDLGAYLARVDRMEYDGERTNNACACS